VTRRRPTTGGHGLLAEGVAFPNCGRAPRLAEQLTARKSVCPGLPALLSEWREEVRRHPAPKVVTE